MKKIIEIGGRDIVFESNGVTPLLYKQAFKSDYFKDLMKTAKVMSKFNGDFDSINFDELEHFDTEILYRIIWACARTANKEIKPMLEWVEDNSEISITDHGMEIVNLVVESMYSKKKS